MVVVVLVVAFFVFDLNHALTLEGLKASLGRFETLRTQSPVKVALVSFASSIGGTLAFLASRFLIRDAIQTRFGDRLKAINEGVAKDGPM